MPDLHCLHHAAFIYLAYDDINDNLKVRGLAECSMKQQTGAQRIMGYGGVAKKKNMLVVSAKSGQKKAAFQVLRTQVN